MKNANYIIVTFSLFVMFVLLSGCGSLSLFSSRHVHYHASPEADKKIENLEQRVEVLEKIIQEQKK